MKKRDKYWLNRLFSFLFLIILFGGTLFFNIVHFNNTYMNEEQEELYVFTRQIEWAILPYLKNKDYATLKKYALDFKDEDINIRIFDSKKNLIASSKEENKSELLSQDSKILRQKHDPWKIYRYSIKDKMLGHVKKLNIEGKTYYLELTVSEADVISSIIREQKIMTIFFAVCILIFLVALIDAVYRIRKRFNSFEDSVIKIANGELDIPVDVSDFELLEELSISVKKMTHRLKNQIQRLTQLEQYKSNFLQSITHEIKTPITAISSAIELLEGKDSLSEEDRECFNIIQFQVGAINKLVNDILCLSEIEVAKTDEKKHFETFNLNSIIKSEINNFSCFETEIRFFENENVDLSGSPSLFSTAVSNILMNAVKYSHSKTIDIFLDKDELRIKDYGIGIAPEYINHVFERFWRVDKTRSRQKGGTGLGLAIVKSIVELHNFSITLKSDIDKGCEFIIKFN